MYFQGPVWLYAFVAAVVGGTLLAIGQLTAGLIFVFVGVGLAVVWERYKHQDRSGLR